MYLNTHINSHRPWTTPGHLIIIRKYFTFIFHNSIVELVWRVSANWFHFQVCFVEFASMLSHKTATKLPPPGLEENWKLLANIERKYTGLRITRRGDGVTSKCSQKASSYLILFERQIVAPMDKYLYYDIMISWKLIYAFLIMIKLTFYKWYGSGME